MKACAKCVPAWFGTSFVAVGLPNCHKVGEDECCHGFDDWYGADGDAGIRTIYDFPIYDFLILHLGKCFRGGRGRLEILVPQPGI